MKLSLKLQTIEDVLNLSYQNIILYNRALSIPSKKDKKEKEISGDKTENITDVLSLFS